MGSFEDTFGSLFDGTFDFPGLGKPKEVFRLCRHCSKAMKIMESPLSAVSDHPICKTCSPSTGTVEVG